jgi:hypothetical protein
VRSHTTECGKPYGVDGSDTRLALKGSIIGASKRKEPSLETVCVLDHCWINLVEGGIASGKRGMKFREHLKAFWDQTL